MNIFFIYQCTLVSFYLCFLFTCVFLLNLLYFLKHNLLVVLLQIGYIPMVEQGYSIQRLQMVSPRVSYLRYNVGSFLICLKFLGPPFDRVLKDFPEDQSPSPKVTQPGLPIVVGNNCLLIGCHPNGCIPSCLVYPIQVSFKLLILIPLTLDDHLG